MNLGGSFSLNVSRSGVDGIFFFGFNPGCFFNV